jgi:hypothetical protein
MQLTDPSDAHSAQSPFEALGHHAMYLQGHTFSRPPAMEAPAGHVLLECPPALCCEVFSQGLHGHRGCRPLCGFQLDPGSCPAAEAASYSSH